MNRWIGFWFQYGVLILIFAGAGCGTSTGVGNVDDDGEVDANSKAPKPLSGKPKEGTTESSSDKISAISFPFSVRTRTPRNLEPSVNSAEKIAGGAPAQAPSGQMDSAESFGESGGNEVAQMDEQVDGPMPAANEASSVDQVATDSIISKDGWEVVSFLMARNVVTQFFWYNDKNELVAESDLASYDVDWLTNAITPAPTGRIFSQNKVKKVKLSLAGEILTLEFQIEKNGILRTVLVRASLSSSVEILVSREENLENLTLAAAMETWFAGMAFEALVESATGKIVLDETHPLSKQFAQNFLDSLEIEVN